MRLLLVAAAATLLAAPSWALYKVVGPDGRVTYTDRPPTAEAARRVSTLNPGRAPAAESRLPYALSQVAQRYPVTLYTAAECVPCDSARQLLQQRGIPYMEKRIVSDDDAQALDQLGAGRMLPGLSIGSRQLRGLNTAEWTSFLDAAGYPRESQLPKGWQPPPAAPLSAPAAAAAAAASQPAAAAGREAPPPLRPLPGDTRPGMTGSPRS